MIGTTLIVTKDKFNKTKLITDEYIEGNQYLVYKNFNKKFLNDKVFHEDEELLIVIDGVILNNHELQNNYGVYDNYSLIKKMYKEHGIRMVDSLRGNFCGIIYDKVEKKWEAFTNHLCSKPLYYYFDIKKECFIVSSDVFDLVKVLKEIDVKATLNEIGAYYLLTFGYMINDTTLIKEINKVDPGTIITYENNTINKTQYFFIDNENFLTDSEDVIVDNMYELFNNSINLAFKRMKNLGISM